MSGILSSLSTRGRTFAAVGIALLITGTGLGMADLTRVGILLIVLPLLTALLVQRHSLAFGVSRRSTPNRVQVDEPATVELTIVNPSRNRSPVIAVEETLDYVLGDRPRCVLPPLRREEGHTLTYEVRSHVRGRHRLGPLELTVTDPFGLTGRAVALQSTAEIVVLPRVVFLGGQALGSHGIGTEGTIPHMVSLHGEDDVSVRAYRDGDELRRVHWPATARTGSLMVRQEDRPSMRRAIVLLDSRESVHGPTVSPSLEWAVTMAASVVAHCESQGYAVHLLTASQDPGIGQESSRLTTCLEALALVEPGPDEDLAGVLHAASGVVVAGGLVIAVVGSCTDDDARAIAALRAPGASGVALVVDRSTLAASAGHLAPGSGALATKEVLRRAGWHVVVVDAELSWAEAWQRLNSRRNMVGVSS
jgi:uncharacterized protein (DUF58 family)